MILKFQISKQALKIDFYLEKKKNHHKQTLHFMSNPMDKYRNVCL